jgi:hypothetical protein
MASRSGLSPWIAEARVNKPMQRMVGKRKNMYKVYIIPPGVVKALARGAGSTRPHCGSGPLAHRFRVRRGVRPAAPGSSPSASLDLVVATSFAATAIVAFSATAAIVASSATVASSAISFIAVSFTVVAAAVSSTVAASSASAYIVVGPLSSEPHACPVAALLGACCPCDASSEMEPPSPRTSLLFLFRGVVSSNDASTSLDGDRESALEADPDDIVFPFPLLELEEAPVLPWPSVESVSWICMPWDMSPTCHIATSMSSSVGICFSSSDLTAWS